MGFMTLLMLLFTLSAATGAGLLFRRLRIPGGLIMGAMLGSGTVTLLSERSTALPTPVAVVAFTAVGLLVGGMLTRDRVRMLKQLWIPATVSSVVLILVGVALGLTLQALGYSSGLAALATSPGAMSVLAGVAVSAGEDAVAVMLFHVVRVILVVLLIPAIIMLRPRRG